MLEPSNTNVGAQQSPDTVAVEKVIFVGSSSADKKLAIEVAKYLSSLPGIAGKCWVDEFPLGLMTFEALERMLHMCVGAVFILDTAESDGRPNDNVMIEIGLVSGRMGRTRVAICTGGHVHLPSDLDAVSRIKEFLSSSDSKTTQAETSDGAILPEAKELLKEWAKVLPAILQGSPCTQVLHGYSGRWRVVLDFEKWRNTPLGRDDIAGLNADALLIIPESGQGGSGTLVGKLTLSWKQSGYSGLFTFCSSISNIACEVDGSLTLRTQTLMRQHTVQHGKPAPHEALPEDLAAPWIFRWDMKPASSGLMEVTFKTDVPPGWTEGKGSAYRESAASLW
jgi:Predicted nucleotide-binding protein containing TIR-like domain